MNLTRLALIRRSVVLLAGFALAVSLFAPATAAQSQSPQTTSTVDDAGVHQAAVDALRNLEGNEIFAGTGCPDSEDFCPHEPLLRWEMAVWLVRSFDRFAPSAIDTSRFADVDPADWWAPYAERLADMGFVAPCKDEPLSFCGEETMTRGEAASVLVKALKLGPPERFWFTDVNSEHPYENDISRLANARLTAGCKTSPARFCPDHNITRGQMSSFLASARRLVPRPGRIDATSYTPAQDSSLLPVDSEVVVGTLDNGLTYYLRHNDSPGQNLSVRLVINAGSINETDSEAGIAHFVEHMLFNGTTEFPGLSLGAALREIGVELGPDVNAYVSHDETVYQVDVRLDDESNAPLVFRALSQMASSATFTPEAVDSERGVILDEMRLAVASLSGFVGREFDKIYTRGTPYEGHDPIGTFESVSSFTAEDLRAFYNKWYLPANMAVVAVGDMEIPELQSLVQEHFGTLVASPGRDASNIQITPDSQSSSHVILDPRHNYSYISLDIPIATHDPSTVGGDRLYTMETLIELMISNRLNDAYQRGELSQVDPPSFSSFSYNRGLRYYATNWQGDNLDTASTDYLNVLLTAQEHGFTDGDLKRAIDTLVAALEFELQSAATTQDGEWAALYQTHFLDGSDISDEEASAARTVELLEALTPAELTEHYRWQMQGDLSRLQINRFLADRAVVVNPVIGESSEGFNAASSSDDVETMFQLIHLMMTAPRVDDRAFADAVNTAEVRLGLSEANAPWQAAVAYLEARYGTTWHRFVANSSEIAALTPESLLEVYKKRLSSVDDLTVAVVGDIDAETIANLATRYIATLPAGEADTYINRQRSAPTELQQRQIKAAEGESGVLEIYFEAEMPVTPLTSVAADVLATAVSERAFLTIRESLGASYTAGAAVSGNRLPRHYFDSSVYATFDPQRFDEVYTAMLELLADVTANGITPQEFEQARAIAASDYALVQNSHLISALIQHSRFGDDNVITQQRRSELLAELTLADVQALAEALYGEDGRIEIITRP